MVVRELGEVFVGEIGGVLQAPGVDAVEDLGSLAILSGGRRLVSTPDRRGDGVTCSSSMNPLSVRWTLAFRPVRTALGSASWRCAFSVPLEVTATTGNRSPSPGGRQRTLLALLALRPGAVVPAERLIDDLWGERAPQQPGNALAGCGVQAASHVGRAT